MFGLHSCQLPQVVAGVFAPSSTVANKMACFRSWVMGSPQLRVEAEAGEGILHQRGIHFKITNNRIRRGRGSSERPSRRLIYLDTYMPCGVYQENGICFEIIVEPNRRAILSLLVSSQQSVGEIERQLRMPQPTVSKHLRVLREAGFVSGTPS